MMFDFLWACAWERKRILHDKASHEEERHTQNTSFTTSGDRGPSQDSLKFIQDLPPSKIPPMQVRSTISRPTTAKYFAFPLKPTFLDPGATHGHIATSDGKGPTQTSGGSQSELGPSNIPEVKLGRSQQELPPLKLQAVKSRPTTAMCSLFPNKSEISNSPKPSKIPPLQTFSTMMRPVTPRKPRKSEVSIEEVAERSFIDWSN